MIQVYFINHRYDGQQLWMLHNVPGLHQLVWLSSFISFFFLYPSTFNLLEVAAVDKPKMHLWETGIMRITRHPQVKFPVFFIWIYVYTGGEFNHRAHGVSGHGINARVVFDDLDVLEIEPTITSDSLPSIRKYMFLHCPML